MAISHEKDCIRQDGKGWKMRKRVLIVEDNDINRKILTRIVSARYDVVEAANGQEALEILDKSQGSIDLILLDIVMPVMNGYEFLKEWKKNSQYASVPVIVTTEHHSEKDEIIALSYGATEFVGKPYQPEIIMHRINSILKLRETSAMVYQLQYDRLTGLYSKEYFYQYSREQRDRNPDKIYDFVCTDIENFHLFNDRYGTEIGDQLLRTIADVYKMILPEDTAVIARFYADHFIAMVEHEEERTMEEKMKYVMDFVRSRYGGMSVTLKWGFYTDNGEDIPIEKKCDNAMMAARSVKGKYGVHYSWFDQALKDELLSEQIIMEEMEQALEDEQFEVYLQPKVRAGSESWMDAEALVRWNHPQKGILPPAMFISVLEKTRFITRLDRYVWKKTCELLQKWEKQGMGRMNVSVNMSQIDIGDEELIDYLEELVQTYQILPSQLHLEITETACIEDQEDAILFINRLREFGFVIEMDDFGCGYSSFNMLMQMPLDILKLDRSLIQNELKKKGGLGYIIGLAHWMKLKVVAEGIETKEQMEYMIQLGCDYIQGYYMAKPMPWKEFENILKEQRGR